MTGKLRCNICSCEIDLADAKEHAGTKRHVEFKTQLEHDLSATREREYVNDVSVVLQWIKSAY